jgi:hypothetical protein
VPSNEPVQYAKVAGSFVAYPFALTPKTHLTEPSSARIRNRSGHSMVPMPGFTYSQTRDQVFRSGDV